MHGRTHTHSHREQDSVTSDARTLRRMILRFICSLMALRVFTTALLPSCEFMCSRRSVSKRTFSSASMRLRSMDPHCSSLWAHKRASSSCSVATLLHRSSTRQSRSVTVALKARCRLAHVVKRILRCRPCARQTHLQIPAWRPRRHRPHPLHPRSFSSLRHRERPRPAPPQPAVRPACHLYLRLSRHPPWSPSLQNAPAPRTFFSGMYPFRDVFARDVSSPWKYARPGPFSTVRE